MNKNSPLEKLANFKRNEIQTAKIYENVLNLTHS